MAVKRTLLILFLSVFAMQAKAQDDQGFQQWLVQFGQEAMEQGITADTLRQSLPLLTYDESVIELDRKQPEKKITFTQYLRNTLPKSRIDDGRDYLATYQTELTRIEELTGVPAAFIVALWGIESSFGENMGDYDVLSSLASLAYEGRRASFFRNELLQALAIVQEEGRPPDSLKGSWAGAMGQCQFMPSTYRRYAVDYNGDNVRDIWGNTGDIFASIGGYLQAEGWVRGLPWGARVLVVGPLDPAFVGPETQMSAHEWAELGVRRIPDINAPLSLIQPDGPSGQSYLVTENFRALMRWNRSTYFATSVGLFADQITDAP